MKIIGLTGGIGSGKTTVSRLLEIRGIPVYTADTESKKLANTSPLIRERLTAAFGSRLYNDGELDRAMLASLIFGNKENLKYVNSVIHPVVFEDFLQWAERQGQSSLVAVESAILFDSGFNVYADVIVNVSAPMEVCIRRIVKRDKVSRQSVEARIRNQMPEEERNRLSDYTILNDEKQALIPQLENLLNVLSAQKK